MTHVAELHLRRYRAGELEEPAAGDVLRHTTACSTCRSRLKALEDEQRTFMEAIPFERFAGGVERARRVPRSRPRPAYVGAALAFAATIAAVVLMTVLPEERGGNRIKGAEVDATLRVAGSDGSQRSVLPGASDDLRPGDRLRIGYRNDAGRYLVALSIDEAGLVTPLYPEHDTSALTVPPHTTLSYLDGSIELTGSGHERIFLLLFQYATPIDDALTAARVGLARARGDLRALASLPLEGRGKVEQFTWLLGKP